MADMRVRADGLFSFGSSLVESMRGQGWRVGVRGGHRVWKHSVIVGVPTAFPKPPAEPV
jgi:hypothetical protein